MTDNEIVKALECCAQPDPICKECPYYDPYLKYPCADQLKWATLNLIDIQKAEIEQQDKEIERLEGILDNYAFEYVSAVDKEMFLKHARAEAVKEFSEMVKEKIRTMSRIVVYDEDVDNLVKEFTEGGDGNQSMQEKLP